MVGFLGRAGAPLMSYAGTREYFRVCSASASATCSCVALISHLLVATCLRRPAQLISGACEIILARLERLFLLTFKLYVNSMNHIECDDVKELYVCFCEQVPEVSLMVKAQMYDAGYCALDEPYAAWFEILTNINNRMMSNFDKRAESVIKQLESLYLLARVDGKKFLDIYAVEGMFYEVSPEACRHYWALLPEALKTRYLAIHGQPPI